jgi:hypothetical protein
MGSIKEKHLIYFFFKVVFVKVGHIAPPPTGPHQISKGQKENEVKLGGHSHF